MMQYSLRLAQPWVLLWLVPLFVIVFLVRWWWHYRAYYRYSMAQSLADAGYAVGNWHEYYFTGNRIVVLALLALLCAKPQWVDIQSSVSVEGIDIMLVLDVSGSMQFQDYDDDRRMRLEVAKDEAIRFIEKRTNDAIGLVLFGQGALSRVPLTADKNLLKTVVKELNFGLINPDGTLLSTALVTAANRLKSSRAASKVIIALTDGEPSEGDLDPSVALEIAKKLGIRIYTVGIGSDQDRTMYDPLRGLVRAPKINAQLLNRFAQETGGKFFVARNAKDMRTIYQTIDQLEKTKLEVPIFSNYYDMFIPIIIAIAVLLFIELILASWWWFGL